MPKTKKQPEQLEPEQMEIVTPEELNAFTQMRMDKARTMKG